MTDVTALVHAEAESGQRADEMSVMLNSIRHGIMLWSADNRLVASNPMAGQMFDFPPDLLIAGRTKSEVVDTMLCQGHLGPARAPRRRLRRCLAVTAPSRMNGR